MMRTRMLHDPKTGKIWGTRARGNLVTVISGAPGKEKETEKPQADSYQTNRFLMKEEGARMRKGFVLTNADAKRGEPVMLRHLTQSYTGALAIAEYDGKLVVNAYNPDRDGDELWLIDRDAVGGAVSFVGKQSMVWTIKPSTAAAGYLLCVDHLIASWNPVDNKIEMLTNQRKTGSTFLDCAGAVATWCEKGEIIVRHLGEQRDLLRLPVKPELYGGHTPQLAGALSPDGSLLASCAHSGQILIHEIAGGTLKTTITGGFEMVDKLAFTPDGKTILAKEQYGRWTIHAFDVEKGAPVSGWPNLGDLGDSDFAIDGATNRLAYQEYGRAHIMDLTTFEEVLEFPIDQLVKRADLSWTADGLLAVHTDAGYVGLYAV